MALASKIQAWHRRSRPWLWPRKGPGLGLGLEGPGLGLGLNFFGRDHITDPDPKLTAHTLLTVPSCSLERQKVQQFICWSSSF